MSSKPPKKYVIYWTSQFAGKHPGYSTPMFKPNMMSFDSHVSAHQALDKLLNLQAVKGTYRGRIVTHVAAHISHNE